MNRRHFMKLAGLSSVVATLPPSFNVLASQPEFNGKFLITIQASGGWDVTSFCDPKINIAGEEKINNWADAADIQTAGNIAYAPFGNNQAFFNKYYKNMLVINGIDAQTNSHSAGVVHNSSGRISEGYPSLTALYAAVNAPTLPISYINNGGYSETGDLIRYTRLDEVGSLSNVIYPNKNQWSTDHGYVHPDEWSLINQFRQQRLARQAQQTNLSVREKLARLNYQSAQANTDSLSSLAETIADAGELQANENGGFGNSSLKRQAQLSLLAMKSGVSCAADLVLGGFDTHDNHDAQQSWLYTNLTDSIDYLWTDAEQLGIADRLVVVLMSDFSRTPYYNDTNGKDHWPISSVVVMEQGTQWGNTTVGLTDEGHNVIPINNQSFVPDSAAGKIIYPMHVMQGLRDYLGLSSNEKSLSFALSPTETFNFFKL